MNPIKKLFHSKVFWIIMAIVLIVRTLTPTFLVQQTNKFLATGELQK